VSVFKNINFGYSSAEKEGASVPALLLDGFMDLNGVMGNIVNDNKYLVLGYKGAGKTAISEHLRLSMKDDQRLCVKQISLKEFPYSELQHISHTGDTGEKYPTAWAWLLLISILEMLVNEKRHFAENADYNLRNIADSLNKTGVLSTSSIRNLVLTSTTKSFKVKLPVAFESEYRRDKREQNMKLSFMVEKLKASISKYRSTYNYYLVIDDLDDVLNIEGPQLATLEALILEVSRINTLLTKEQSPIHIVLLCRTDLYSKLPGPNNNKFRQDSGIILDWYHDPSDFMESDLVRLANHKAQVTDNSINDLFSSFFPIDANNDLKKDILLEVFESTRHTPRDFLRALSYIQNAIPQKPFADLISRRVTPEEIFKGLRNYSIDYFYQEIKDEISGYLTPNQVSCAFNAFGTIRKRQFSFTTFEALLRENTTSDSNIDALAIAHTLFECSAIGNILKPIKTNHDAHFTFKYRNRNASFNKNEDIILHRGLHKALNAT
jgi:uridine kinase